MDKTAKENYDACFGLLKMKRMELARWPKTCVLQRLKIRKSINKIFADMKVLRINADVRV